MTPASTYGLLVIERTETRRTARQAKARKGKEATMAQSTLDPRIQRGARVASTQSPFEGTVTRVISTQGETGGIAEVRWDFQKRVSRSAGFAAGESLVVIKEAPAV